VLIADVSEHSIGSIFKGRSMKNGRGWDVWGIYTGPGSGRSVAEPMGRWVAGWGWLGGGRYIRHVWVRSLYYIRWPSLFLEFVQQWFPGFAEVESHISVNVIRMQFYWLNRINQQLLNIVSIRTTSSDYRTPNSSPPKPVTWIASSGKPSKYKCILTTLTEMGDSTSANPGNHCCKNSRKRDRHRI
jgi:hypothetical protein